MVTIKDIAKLANVSISTVSKALNDRRDIGRETKEKIIKIAKELKYDHHRLRKLEAEKTNNIGVIFCREGRPLSNNPFYSRVLEGIEGEIVINNYNLILQLIPDPETNKLPKMIRDNQVDGIIVVGVFNELFTNIIRNSIIPAVFVDPKVYLDKETQVLIDNEHGGFIATRYLINKGHKRIAFVSGQLERLSFNQRYIGYKKALDFYGIEFDENLVKTGGLERGYEHTISLLENENPPTAIFYANDLNAIYGYKAIKDKGLKIPDDVSVMGFDDIDMAKFSNPPLTTVRVYKEEMGSIAVRQLLNVISGKSYRGVTTIVPVKLIERQSA
ncbi:MAG: LacI family DNA-binding transcriptional regulator [Candidatus Marinimicrobia bacterium]|nr:LacI family DNA-binding transcriptional regulator [Candidatus Neomarinimicrobiota bacterium]